MTQKIRNSAAEQAFIDGFIKATGLTSDDALKEEVEVEKRRFAKFEEMAGQIERRGKFLGWMNKKQRKRLGALRTNIIKLRGRIAEMERSYVTPRLHELYGRLLAIPRVESISARSDILIVFTDLLFGKDKNHQWHVVGRFRIVFNLRKSIHLDTSHLDICWENLTHPRPDLQGPPNINRQGLVSCFGDARAPLVSALQRGDWETVVAIAVRYPECAGTHDAIRLWPAARDEEVPPWYLDMFGANGKEGLVPAFVKTPNTIMY